VHREDPNGIRRKVLRPWHRAASRSGDIARSIWRRFAVHKPPPWAAIFRRQVISSPDAQISSRATSEIAAGNDAATVFTQTPRVETIPQDSRVRARCGLARSCETASPCTTSLPFDVDREDRRDACLSRDEHSRPRGYSERIIERRLKVKSQPGFGILMLEREDLRLS